MNPLFSALAGIMRCSVFFLYYLFIWIVVIALCKCIKENKTTKTEKEMHTLNDTYNIHNCHSIVKVGAADAAIAFTVKWNWIHWKWNGNWLFKSKKKNRKTKHRMKEKVHQNAIVVAIRYHISDSVVALNGDAFCIMRLVWLVHMNSPHLKSRPFRWLRIRCWRIRCNHDHLLRVELLLSPISYTERAQYFTPNKEKKNKQQQEKHQLIRRDTNYTSMDLCSQRWEQRPFAIANRIACCSRKSNRRILLTDSKVDFFFSPKAKYVSQICHNNSEILFSVTKWFCQTILGTLAMPLFFCLYHKCSTFETTPSLNKTKNKKNAN